jgi:hypothetical protein
MSSFQSCDTALVRRNASFQVVICIGAPQRRELTPATIETGDIDAFFITK